MTEYKDTVKKCKKVSMALVLAVLLLSLVACSKGPKLTKPTTTYETYKTETMFVDQPSSAIKKELAEYYQEELLINGIKVVTLSYGESVGELIHETKEDFTKEEYLDLISSSKIKQPTFLTFFIVSENAAKEGIEQLILLSSELSMDEFEHYFTAMIVDTDTYRKNQFDYEGDATKYLPMIERGLEENKESFGGMIDGAWDPMNAANLEETALSWDALMKVLKLNEN